MMIKQKLTRKDLLFITCSESFPSQYQRKSLCFPPCAKAVRLNKCTIAKCQGSEVKIKLHKFELHKSHRLGG